MKKLLFGALLIATLVRAYSQPIVNNTSIVPPAPNTAALGTYGTHPVGLYTGTPQIDIPLYTLHENGYSLPISLSYHASGIRVNQYATWVGLGWTLNAGGVVARTMRGLPDEKLEGNKAGYIYSPVNNMVDGKFVSGSMGGNSSPIGAYTPIPNGQLANDLAKFSNGEYDGIPDLFNFNVGGLSGSFCLMGDGTTNTVPYAHILSPADVKINILWNAGNAWDSRLLGFVIVSAEGVAFTFNKREISSSSSLPAAGFQCSADGDLMDEGAYTLLAGI